MDFYWTLRSSVTPKVTANFFQLVVGDAALSTVSIDCACFDCIVV